MRKFTFFILFLMATSFLQAQEQKPKLYNPQADARQEISKSLKQAKVEGKHVLLMVGGNW